MADKFDQKGKLRERKENGKKCTSEGTFSKTAVSHGKSCETPLFVSENLPFSWFQMKVDFAVLKLAHTQNDPCVTGRLFL